MIKSFEEVVSVKIIGMTQPVVDFIPDSEGLISYAARVSSPQNQDKFDTAVKLLNYCAEHGHWSVFEMADVVIEVCAPRDISRQILRHKSGSFQEFSQRYAEVSDDMFVWREARLQDTKNRQNSIQVDDNGLQEWWRVKQEYVIEVAQQAYKEALEKGLAKECARVVLPEGNTMSRMYFKAPIRTMIHYCSKDNGVRRGNGTQLEHDVVAQHTAKLLQSYFPSIFKEER